MSEVKVSFAVMHHPARFEAALDLLRVLGPGVDLISDRFTEKTWETAKRAWLSAPVSATHRVVLQDDVCPVKDFTATVEKAVRAKPDAILSFYANRASMEEAREKDARWVKIPDGTWGQALCIPVHLIRKIIHWSEQYFSPECKIDDTRIACWALAHDYPVWCTAPSLVEHVGAAHSLIGYSNKRRVARWFPGVEFLGADLDWANGAAIVDKKAGSLSSMYRAYPHFFVRDPRRGD